MGKAKRALAIEAIRLAKARYWRGVDTRDDALVRSVLAEDCVLDYRDCCRDPRTGVDHMPQMNMVMHGRDAWQTGNLDGPVTAHQGHQDEIVLTNAESADAIFVFTDCFFMPAGAPFARLVGHGYYHETYVKVDGVWLLQSTRITRLWVETN